MFAIFLNMLGMLLAISLSFFSPLLIKIPLLAIVAIILYRLAKRIQNNELIGVAGKFICFVQFYFVVFLWSMAVIVSIAQSQVFLFQS